MLKQIFLSTRIWYRLIGIWQGAKIYLFILPIEQLCMNETSSYYSGVRSFINGSNMWRFYTAHKNLSHFKVYLCSILNFLLALNLFKIMCVFYSMCDLKKISLLLYRWVNWYVFYYPCFKCYFIFVNFLINQLCVKYINFLTSHPALNYFLCMLLCAMVINK